MYINFNETKRKIGGLDYSILKPSQIINMAEVRVMKHQIYEGTQVSDFGPLDLRMGQNHKSFDCKSCNTVPKSDCPGHFGYIDLSTPIFHLGFFRHVIMCLNCICLKCNAVKLDQEVLLYYQEKMTKCLLQKNYRRGFGLFKEYVAVSKKVKYCKNCDHKFDGIVKKQEKVAGKIVYQSQEINPIQVFYLFRNVPKQLHILFGINPFKNELTDLVTTIMPTPPNIIRPSVMLQQGMAGDDDLTIKIKNIVSINNQLEKPGEPYYKIQKQQYILQSHYFHYFNSDLNGLPFQDMDGKQAIRGFYQRLKGKTGRFRGNLSGKRADFNGRTVISPDPNLAIDQVTIPMFMAKILTIPDIVNQTNIQKMKDLVLRGPQNYPGANFVLQGNNKRDLAYGNRRQIANQLKIGDIVERHLANDDIILFNRQPSLHRISIMAFRAKVDKWHTLRFNESCCTPFNADFDGDEMNIHVPQTLEARAEALEIMSVIQNLRTIKSGESIVCLLQDFLTTGWLITNKDVFYTKDQFMQICTSFTDAQEMIQLPAPAIILPIQLWTGKQVINTLLRPNKKARLILNLEVKEANAKTNDCMDPRDGYVVFQNSELICGNLGKKVLGASKTGLFYSINRDNSPEVAALIMQRFSKLSSRWISHYGMTLGIGDVTPDENLIQQNYDQIENSYNLCQEDIKLYDQNQLESRPGLTVEETLESLIKTKLSDVRQVIGDNCRDFLKTDNKVLIMFLCGAKGSNINMSQMIGCVGQQVVSGHRVPDGFSQRTLPHFSLNDRHPRAKGFVKNSFYTGLDAIEFFFHTMGGREGLIDTAVKTADTGYMQRRLIKMLEDLHVSYDLTVRSCDTKEIIQFIYGEDGLDPSLVEDVNDPINLNFIYQNSKTVIKITKPLKPQAILDKIAAALNILEKKYSMYLAICQDTYIRAKKKFEQYFENKVKNIRAYLIKYGFDVEGVIKNYENISSLQIQWICKTWMERFLNMVTVPGTSVGPIASQSIGEPATQMTLKTFHFAGVASMNVTLGVPRIKEIINAAKQIKTPIIKIKLDEKLIYNDQAARKILIQIENTTLGQILQEIQEVYFIDGCNLILHLDWKKIKQLQLDVTSEKIRQCIIQTPKMKLLPDQIQIEGTRIKINFESIGKKQVQNILFEMCQIKHKIMNVHINGLNRVKKVIINKVEKDMGIDKKDERVLFADGYGLKEVLQIDGVNEVFTRTNHIMEIYNVLGVEAARNSIIEEIVTTMKAHGILLDIRHILLAAETMTFKGKILPFTRFGVDKLKQSTLMLASFEKTMEILFNAAIQGKKDSLNGVSQRIIMGQNIPVGTGLFDVMWGKDAKIMSIPKEQKFMFE